MRTDDFQNRILSPEDDPSFYLEGVEGRKTANLAQSEDGKTWTAEIFDEEGNPLFALEDFTSQAAIEQHLRAHGVEPLSMEPDEDEG